MPLISQKLIALIILIITLPLYPMLYLLVKFTSKGPFIFKQKRMGKNKKTFIMYKIRTMIYGAEKLQSKYSQINEADGPVFKIKNDPRFTPVGKFLSKFAIDELPQLINVLRGEMALVGPRPLPVNEAKKVPHKYNARFSVLPGMTSPWIIRGNHKLSFKTWMELDLEYVEKKSILRDLKILTITLFGILKNFFFD